MSHWTFEDAIRHLDALLDAARSAPQIIERDGQRFVVSLIAGASNKDVDLLLKGGPLEGNDLS